MTTKRYVIIYIKGNSRRVIDEITVTGETEEECFDNACQYIGDYFSVEETTSPSQQL